ncbi:DUF4190 domain-containing protein [Microbacterium cremeum]|uniref:DUF4190 domain-containing protein n=1 Tax=Microbacterium cremeum TaxID=2782169 RepID=UPI001886C853|nr:DUF4190 domain-containing protein [Microbacterium cremeum]
MSDSNASNPTPEPGSQPPAPPAAPAGQQTPGAYPPPPPAYGAPAAPPAYGTPGAAPAAAPYGAAPQYGQPYGAAPAYGYGYGAQPKTNVLAIVSLVASIVGFIGLLPIIGSIAAVIMGHISLNQLKTNGENGRGMALAGTIVGYVGLGLWIIGIIAFFGFIALMIPYTYEYGTYSS